MDSTVMERIEMMNKTLNEEKEAKARALEKEEELKAKLIDEIAGMKDRIEALIVLGNKLREEKQLVQITWYHEAREPDVFRAEGFYHHVGFMEQGYDGFDTPIRYLGIEMGGACGPWDFYTNGEITFSMHEKTKERKTPSISDLKSFIKEFGSFEKRFYEWFDKRFGKEKKDG